MLVDKIIADIEAQEKLASQAPAPDPRTTAEGQLSEALGKTLDKVASQAAPANGDPVQDLFKLAGEVIEAEKQGEVQQAAMCGRAFAHAAIDEFRAYDNAAKLAAAQQAPSLADQAVKVAASDNELMKAAELGYRDAVLRVQEASQVQGQVKEAQMEEKLASVNMDDRLLEKMAQVGYAQTQEKIAAEQYQQGYAACMNEVRDRAAEEFLKGAAEVDQLIAISQQG